jgi:hypothetical protein
MKPSSIFNVLPKSINKKSLLRAAIFDLCAATLTEIVAPIIYGNRYPLSEGTVIQGSIFAFPAILLIVILTEIALLGGRSGLVKKIIESSEKDSKGDHEHDNSY